LTLNAKVMRLSLYGPQAGQGKESGQRTWVPCPAVGRYRQRSGRSPALPYPVGYFNNKGDPYNILDEGR
jgi:hypothetical protein